jgi:putative oxidoreductase
MDVVFLVGRVLFGILFLSSGIMGHLVGRAQMVPYATARGAPAPQVTVPLTGVQIVAGALSVILGVWVDLGALLLAIFTVSTAVLMHAFWRESDPMARINEQVQFLKDLALAGASLVLFAAAATGGQVGPTITGPLFDL